MKIIYKDGHVDECPQDQELHVIRHTAAHIMAQAIKRLYPQPEFPLPPFYISFSHLSILQTHSSSSLHFVETSCFFFPILL